MSITVFMFKKCKISDTFSSAKQIVVFPGDCLELLRQIPDGSVQLVVTSPPYNIGKEYEKKLRLERYLQQQAEVIRDCTRVLAPRGSICWQVGNYVEDGAIVPLDTLLYPIFTGLGLSMRNRVIWHFEHGLHCTNRFSGRYETILGSRSPETTSSILIRCECLRSIPARSIQRA